MKKLFTFAEWLLAILYFVFAIAAIGQSIFLALAFLFTALVLYPSVRKRILGGKSPRKGLQPDNQQGYSPENNFVYVISNDAFESGIFKIGMTTQSPRERVNQINSATGVPQPFLIDLLFSTPDARQLEATLHQHFSNRRVSSAREFFKLDYDDVLWLIHSQNTIYANFNHLRLKHGYDFTVKNEKPSGLFGWLKRGSQKHF